MEMINDLLEYKNLKIIQNSKWFNFSLDSVLLARFVTINKKINSIIDFGCGNAVIPLILSTRTNSKLIGIEIQKEICNLAEKSVLINNLEDKITIINDDINNAYKIYNTDSIDVITCNPPYFKRQESSIINDNNNKSIARHEITITLEDIIMSARKLLKNNGVVALVHRPDRLIDIVMLMRKNNIEPKRLQFVYPKKDMEANIILIEGRKNGKPGLKILPPLYVHFNNGKYRNEIKKLFS